MSKVYRTIPFAPDKLLGHVESDGTIYHNRFGPDELIGHVDLATGHIYERHFGPDKAIGRVDLSNGNVYLSRFGPDEHVGEVNTNGRILRQKRLAADDDIGNVEPFISYAHSAGAMLLLVLPALEKSNEENTQISEPTVDIPDDPDQEISA